jgi:hypothetical protein
MKPTRRDAAVDGALIVLAAIVILRLVGAH